jgi:hypothetical protein
MPACLHTGGNGGTVARSAASSRSAGPAVADAAPVTSYHPLPQPAPPAEPHAPEPFAVAAQPPEAQAVPPEAPAAEIPPPEPPSSSLPAAGSADRAQPAPAAEPSALDSPASAALRCLLDRRPDQAVGQLKDVEQPRQDVLLGLLALSARFAEAGPVKAGDLGELVDRLDGLVAPLRPLAPLKIEHMCFCRRIKTFGVYDPLPDRAPFRADEQVQVYVELKNFATAEVRRPGGEIRHVIKLASSYEIQDERRRAVCGDTFQRDGDTADESRTPRHDYFENYTFTVPPGLKPGLYTLVIRVDDLGTDPPRSVQRSLDFYVSSLGAGVWGVN